LQVRPINTLDILGEQVEIYVTGEMTGGTAAVIVQISPPGGGPPPHKHSREDETFCVLEGSFEFFEDGVWQPLTVGVPVFSRRGVVHAFRNTGSAPGRMLVLANPAGMEIFFAELAGLSAATDMPRIAEVFAKYALTFG
jgi:quercetin dioxygenase-like cupin family protein